MQREPDPHLQSPAAVRQYASTSRFTRNVALVVAVSTAVKALGFVEKQTLAFFFGATVETDAYLAATELIQSVFVVVREVVESAFIPVFLKQGVKTGLASTAGLTQVALRLVALIGCAMALLSLFFAKEIANGIAPGLSNEGAADLAILVKWSGSFFPVLCVSALTYALLNALGRFGQAALGDLAAKATLVLTLFIAGRWGAAPIALAFGIGLGSLARLIVHVTAASNLDLSRASGRADPSTLKTIVYLMLPLAIGVLASRLGDLGENYFGSYLPMGSISAKSFARKLAELPVVVLPYALGVVAFPTLTSMAASREWQRYHELLKRVLLTTTLALTPIALVMGFHSMAIVRIVLERGAFTPTASLTTASVLRCYAVGLPVFALDSILTQAYFARLRLWLPTLVGIACSGLKLLVMAIFVRRFGVPTIAAALVFAKTIKVIVLGTVLYAGSGHGFAALGREFLLAYVLPLGLSYAVGIVAVGHALPFREWSQVDAAYSLTLAVHSVCCASAFGAALLVLPSTSARLLLGVLRWPNKAAADG